MDLILTIIDDLGGIFPCYTNNPPGAKDQKSGHSVQEYITPYINYNPHTNQDSIGGG